jgi:xanthine dehydrogenase accessory protein XdhC
MIALAPLLRQALDCGEPAILVTVARAQGSTPREEGATMLVTQRASHGTIGGGQLEFHAIDVARGMMFAQDRERRLDLPLGPHLGQCCGGRVELMLSRADAHALGRLAEEEMRIEMAKPHVLLFGAGHVGLALARALALLPLRVTLIDDREADAPALPAGVSFERVDDPEPLVESAPAGSAFLILTHSHSLDYRLAAAALSRSDAGYVGMIGSATKRSRFERWFLQRGGRPEALRRFVCPIGGKATLDKRPEVIAALTTAEILAHLLAAPGRKFAARGRKHAARSQVREELGRSIRAA